MVIGKMILAPLTAPALCRYPLRSDLTLDARSSYLISGPVVVGNGHNELASDGNLAVARRFRMYSGTRIEIDRSNR